METTDADDAADDDEDDDGGGGNSGGWSWHLVSRYISSISRRPLLCRQPPSVSVSCISESPLLTFGCASDVDEGTRPGYLLNNPCNGRTAAHPLPALGVASLLTLLTQSYHPVASYSRDSGVCLICSRLLSVFTWNFTPPAPSLLSAQPPDAPLSISSARAPRNRIVAY